MKKVALVIFCFIYVTGQAQPFINRNIIGKWKSINGIKTVLEFNQDFERKYHLRKGIKIVLDYNIEQARYSTNRNILYEHQAGGGGINLTLQFEIYKDTLKITYRDGVILLYKKINNKTFHALVGKYG